MAQAAAATPPVILAPALALAEPEQYSYSTGNGSSAFPKVNGKSYSHDRGIWRVGYMLMVNGRS
jgi:hypothetical protein